LKEEGTLIVGLLRRVPIGPVIYFAPGTAALLASELYRFSAAGLNSGLAPERSFRDSRNKENEYKIPAFCFVAKNAHLNPQFYAMPSSQIFLWK
jgi:hypothetical protein